MGQESRSERGERRYHNADYDEVPNAAPLALRAIHDMIIRRARTVRSRADMTLAAIDHLLGEEARNLDAPTPPGKPERCRPSDEEKMLPSPSLRKKLGAAAVLETQSDGIDFPPEAQAT